MSLKTYAEDPRVASYIAEMSTVKNVDIREFLLGNFPIVVADQIRKLALSAFGYGRDNQTKCIVGIFLACRDRNPDQFETMTLGEIAEYFAAELKADRFNFSKFRVAAGIDTVGVIAPSYEHAG